MFKNIALVLPAALLAATTVMAQCTNNACQVANAIYKECKYSTTTTADFQKCLCTEKFLVNYQRCLNGFVCSWDGNPSTLNQPCIALYCPGTFDGGFDAIAFCRGTLTSGYPVSSTVKTSTTSTKSTPVLTYNTRTTTTSSSTRPVITYNTRTSTTTSSSTRPVITYNTRTSTTTKTSTSTRPVITYVPPTYPPPVDA